MPDRPESIPVVPMPKVFPPERYEDAQGFRESFLLWVTDPHLNGALRVLGTSLFEMILEHSRYWHSLPGTLTAWEVQAALGDLRHLQGFLAAIGRERTESDPTFNVDPELCGVAEIEAEVLRQVGDRIEQALFGKPEAKK